MSKQLCRPVSLTDARTLQRVRVTGFTPGAALVPLCPPLPILGYWHRQVGHLTVSSVYVPGTMPPALRTAAEAGRTTEETWLTPVPAGIREIDLTDCRGEFLLLLPESDTLTAQAA